MERKVLRLDRSAIRFSIKLRTENIMTIFDMIGMAKDLCKTYGIDDVAGIIYALVGFLILTPSILSTDNAAGIPMGNLSASGLFLGMMSTVLAVEIVRFVLGRGWTIKMPDSVPAKRCEII